MSAPEPLFESPVCRICGCDDWNRCDTEHGGCVWVELDLCSACVGIEDLEDDEEEEITL